MGGTSEETANVLVKRDAQDTKDGTSIPEPVLVERTVITESLMREAIIKHMDQNDSSVVIAKESLVLEEVPEMSLSFENIYCIDNIVGFKSLTKLQLDNNIIDKIQGLDELVNLTWLDLSFNNITKIEGLDKLVNLTDLSLFNNQIETIENLDKCVNLHVLSVGNNKINQVDNIKSLRGFKRLRLLNLKGNPVTANDHYQKVVLAYLEDLKYLDYQLIDEQTRQNAVDDYLDEINVLREKENDEAVVKVETAKVTKHSDLLEKANISSFLTIFDSMVFKSDEVYKKIHILPGLEDLHEQYRERFNTVLKPMEDGVLSTHKTKTIEKKDFMDARERNTRQNEEESIAKVQTFEAVKKRVFNQYQQLRDDPNNVKPPSQVLVDFKEEVEALRGDLMDVEMFLVEQLTDSIDEFDENWTKELSNNSNKFAEKFAKLQEVAQWYVEALKDLVMKLLVDLAEYEINLENSITLDGLQAAAAAEAKAKEEEAIKMEKEAQEAMEAGYDPEEIKEKQEKEMKEREVAAAEEKNIFDNPELVKLLSDKDAIINVVGQSGENHVACIMAAEDVVREKEMRNGQALVTDIRADECSRNRQRVTEIEMLIDVYLKEIKDKLDDESKDDDDEGYYINEMS